jgi:hypothetical protein
VGKVSATWVEAIGWIVIGQLGVLFSIFIYCL